MRYLTLLLFLITGYIDIIAFLLLHCWFLAVILIHRNLGQWEHPLFGAIAAYLVVLQGQTCVVIRGLEGKQLLCSP